jgi:NfeD-like C-terminal, partner-binding
LKPIIHIAVMSRTSPSAAPSVSDAAPDLHKGLLGRGRQGEVVDAAALEHRSRGGWQRRPIEELERGQDRRGTYLQIDVPDALLGHVERLTGVEDALIESRETVDVLGQPGGEGLVGERGEVIVRCAPLGRVRLRGEIWNARCEGPLELGEEVRVEAVDGLTLVVARASNATRRTALGATPSPAPTQRRAD